MKKLALAVSMLSLMAVPLYAQEYEGSDQWEYLRPHTQAPARAAVPAPVNTTPPIEGWLRTTNGAPQPQFARDPNAATATGTPQPQLVRDPNAASATGVTPHPSSRGPGAGVGY